MDTSAGKQAVLLAIAHHIDEEIHRHYRLYPCNYVALDLMQGTTDYRCHYTADDMSAFETYLEGQLAKIDIPNKDEAFLRARIIEMYANPAKNYFAAQR